MAPIWLYSDNQMFYGKSLCSGFVLSQRETLKIDGFVIKKQVAVIQFFHQTNITLHKA